MYNRLLIKESSMHKIYTIVRWIKNILVILLLGVVFYTTLPIQTTKTLFVPQGSIKYILAQLSKQGHSLSIIDTYLLVAMGKPQSGWVTIGDTHLNRIDFLYRLTTAKASMRAITLIPGETSTLFFESLATTLDLNQTKLNYFYQHLSPYLEAGIYADTYYVPYGMTEQRLIAFLVQESDKKYKEIAQKIYGKYDKKQWLKILIVASIIQKEAANVEEMPMVGSVIHNRLKKGMPLQMDGTLNYGKYSHIKVTPERIKNDTSAFNTYKHKGLPPSPIGSVSFDAILSAMKPAKTNYLYFMKNEKGVHDFTDTFQSHRQNIKKMR